MTLKEAYKILGVSKENTDREIKAKYKKLLIMYHPDSDPTGKRDPEDDDKIRLVIEAYRKIRESEGEPYYDAYEFTWDVMENKDAFAQRNIFFQFKIYDEALPPSKMARGRFVWDPDMEEFSLFAKSVLEACKETITDRDIIQEPDIVKNIFHLMMQEYVLPADAARKIGRMIRQQGDCEVYSFSGFIKKEPGSSLGSTPSSATPLTIYFREDRAVVEELVTGRILGTISFDEDELYYVVLPLLEDPQVEASVNITKGNLVSIELAIPIALTDRPVVNGKVIKELLR